MALSSPLRPSLTEPELRRTSAFVKNGVKCLALYRGQSALKCVRMSPKSLQCSICFDKACVYDLTTSSTECSSWHDGSASASLLQNQNLSRYFADCLAMILVRDKLKHLEDPVVLAPSS